jgi:hypothetical protein
MPVAAALAGAGDDEIAHAGQPAKVSPWPPGASIPVMEVLTCDTRQREATRGNARHENVKKELALGNARQRVCPLAVSGSRTYE